MNSAAMNPTARRKPRPRLSISGAIGMAIVAFWLLMALIGPSIAPHGVGGQIGDDVFAPMSAQYWLGTDYLGRDMLSRILHGAPYTIGVAFAGVTLACTLGLVLALCAAANGGWLDHLISRVMDTLIAIPNKLLALIIVAAFGSSVPLLIVTAAVC